MRKQVGGFARTCPQNDESWVLLIRCASFLHSRISVYWPVFCIWRSFVSLSALGSTQLDQNALHAFLP